MPRLCVFGASSTWGAIDKEKGGWVNRLRLFIESNGYDYSVYNLGISGDTTNDVLHRFDIEAEARKAKAILFSLGDNDSVFDMELGTNWTSLEQYKNNLQLLIDKAKKFTDKIAFCGPKKIDESKTTPVPWRTSLHYREKDVLEYGKALETIANENGVPYLQLYDALQFGDLADGIHPNESGHQKIFEKVRDFLLENQIIAK